MTATLFRKEVLDARRAGWLGGIVLAQPLRLWLLTVATTVVALSVVLFLVFGTYTRRSSVTGQLVPSHGLATVLAPETGVVAQVEVPEGGTVQAGQTLAVVRVPRATLASGDTVAALEHGLRQRRAGLDATQAAQVQVLEAQRDGLSEQLAAAQLELAQVDGEIAIRERQVRIAEETLGRLRQLEDSAYVSVLQIKQQETTALEYAGQVQALQRQAQSARRSIAQLEQAARELPGQRRNAEAGYQRDTALLEQERIETEARGALAIAAPVAGVISTQLAKPGQAAQAGQPLMSLLPGDGRLEAELLVPSRDRLHRVR